MLDIYPVILNFVEEVAPLIMRIARHDADLARQLRRSSASVALNTAEGTYARGRARTHCYGIALREMRESCFMGGSTPPPGAALTRTPPPAAVLEVSVRLRYIPSLSTKLDARAARILGTLVRLTFPRRAE